MAGKSKRNPWKSKKTGESKKVSENREEYTLIGEIWGDEEDAAQDNERIEALDRYNYFDVKSIENSVIIPEDVSGKGIKLYAQGLFSDFELITGFSRFGDSDPLGQATWSGIHGNDDITTRIIFNRTEITDTSCNCRKCTKRHSSYHWYQDVMSECEYVAGLILATGKYLENNNVCDATDRIADSFLDICLSKKANLMVADSTSSEKSVMLKPRLVKKDGKLSVSFRIGTGKMLLIKQLGDFCDNVRNAAEGKYGSSTVINHRRSNFTDESQKWLRFIERIVQEEEEFNQRMNDAMMTQSRYYYYQKPASVGGSLNLFGWRMDEFYQTLGDGKVDYEDRDAFEKVKLKLSCGAGNPPLVIDISEAILDGDESAEFQGIRVEGSLPELFYGMDQAYYVDNDAASLCRSDKGFREKIEPLTPFVDDSAEFSFVIGRNRMAEFYYRILPSLAEIADIVETDPQKFHSYLPPQVRFVFYMDADRSDAYCIPKAAYGEIEFSLLDFLKNDENLFKQYRDISGESDMLQILMRWIPLVDFENDELSCGGDEETIYRLIAEGVDELLRYGEVHCTRRFLNRRKVRHVQVSVGVSVSGGLLDLDIASEGFSMEELLDVLYSYREKRTYHRLKDGSYVDMNDESLELLEEMMESMHLKPKDFVKGKMHLPLYRTLYLNKMLEENEEIYADRDSHFREIVKEFKTIDDSDFEVPKSLSGIMRPYQKEGYQWLRMLDTWQFGGILADDMGLGKTLQIIAVLLAAKENRKENDTKQSLVVVPASVVFNWEDEFTRFAPELNILLVTGTQGERREKLEDIGDYDVLVTSYDLLKRDIDLYEDIRFEYEIIDEAQYIKNHTTAAAKAVKVIKSTYRFALTGTPIENRLSELWSIFDFLMPGFMYTYDVFRKELETPIVKNQDEQAMKRLQKMTGPFILRRLKENVLKDLPEKLEEERYVRFGEEQRKIYGGQVARMRQKLSGQSEEEFVRNKIVVLAELTKLRQICCDPSLCFENYRGGSAKLDACMELVESAIDGGHRILLFSQFTSMLDILSRRLDDGGIPYYTIVGATPKEERLRLAKRFNEGSVPVFLVSLKAGGVGLNLTGADVVIHYDPWWNVAAQNQATDRAHRIGQNKKVTVYKLLMKGSVEEKILKLQNTKRDLAEQVISGDAGQLAGMTKEDLLELLAE